MLCIRMDSCLFDDIEKLERQQHNIKLNAQSRSVELYRITWVRYGSFNSAYGWAELLVWGEIWT